MEEHRRRGQKSDGAAWLDERRALMRLPRAAKHTKDQDRNVIQSTPPPPPPPPRTSGATTPLAWPTPLKILLVAVVVLLILVFIKCSHRPPAPQVPAEYPEEPLKVTIHLANDISTTLAALDSPTTALGELVDVSGRANLIIMKLDHQAHDLGRKNLKVIIRQAAAADPSKPINNIAVNQLPQQMKSHQSTVLTHQSLIRAAVASVEDVSSAFDAYVDAERELLHKTGRDIALGKDTRDSRNAQLAERRKHEAATLHINQTLASLHHELRAYALRYSELHDALESVASKMHTSALTTADLKHEVFNMFSNFATDKVAEEEFKALFGTLAEECSTICKMCYYVPFYYRP